MSQFQFICVPLTGFKVLCFSLVLNMYKKAKKFVHKELKHGGTISDFLHSVANIYIDTYVVRLLTFLIDHFYWF